jgi:hypothetical protein
MFLIYNSFIPFQHEQNLAFGSSTELTDEFNIFLSDKEVLKLESIVGDGGPKLITFPGGNF